MGARLLRSWMRFVAAVLAALFGAAAPAIAQPRALGLDISAWQGNISQTTWNNIHNVENRDFVFIRSSRGGTTGYYNQSDPNNNNGLNTLSQRYDDPYFVQNITRATNSGMLAGPYHFSRPDIIASTLNANGIANTGADEADHFIQMAGAWMRPGYLLPVHDLEAGQSQRSSSQLSAFAVDFSNRLYEVMGIRPMVYTGQNYANYINSTVPAAYPDLWLARWPNQANPDAIDVQNINPPPSPSTANVYGAWNPNHTVGNPYPDGHPWKFWQYASTGRLQSFNNGNSNLDFDVAHGGTEFLKDHLVPALWMNDASGGWSTLANWNSGQTPVAPVQGPGQVARVGSLTLPATRLPGVNDTVVLERPNADIGVTLDSGTHNIRKLYVRETLNITGGSLTVNYVPTADSTPIAAQFSAPVSLSGNGSLSVHTLQVDATQSLTLGGGSLTFDTISLVPHSSTPAEIAVTGGVNFNSLANAAATIINGAGVGNSGLVDLSGGDRAFYVADGSAEIDLSINVPIANGALTKNGLGTLALNGANLYAGDTTLLAGKLSIASPFLSNMADVHLSTGTTLDLNFAGMPDSVNALFIGGVPQAEGTWGAVGNSNADFQSPLITGTGLLQVTEFIEQPLMPTVLADFNVDEGPFGWPYNTSPASQTFGLSAGTTIDRVTTEAFEGAGSQELSLVGDVAGWQLRHNSGVGTVAAPGGNVPFVAEGFVGMWLKTTDSGVSVQIALDDPGTADRGLSKELIADGLWHLYEWDLDDELQWEGWVTGDGVITGPTVTLDSIFFAGNGNATIFMDLVMHNPLGSLLPEVLPGDYNRDGVVGPEDYTAWKQAFGQSVEPNSGADGNGDGMVDSADYSIWRDNLGAGASSATGAATAVPEPACVALLWIALASIGLRKIERKMR